MEATPPSTPRKRGRPKGSTSKSKDKDGAVSSPASKTRSIASSPASNTRSAAVSSPASNTRSAALSSPASNTRSAAVSSPASNTRSSAVSSPASNTRRAAVSSPASKMKNVVSSPASASAPAVASGSGSADTDKRYMEWKSIIPVLYDWFTNHNLVWPSLACRWGPIVGQENNKNQQRLYMCEQTDGTAPNTLIVATCEVVKPRVAAAAHIEKFDEEAHSPFVKTYKTLIHPGEVNRIRELPQNKNIVATHTDSCEVLIWDLENQPNRVAVHHATDSLPDLVLTGHQKNAEYALAMCPTEPFVLSGGKDKNVVLWSIQDHISTLATHTSSSIVKTADNSHVTPRGIFQGHQDTVEDVQFCPSSSQEFCSVGDDSSLILWDARVGVSPAIKVEKAHDDDIHCVDWSPINQHFILTGSADHTVRMFDRRKLSSGGTGLPVRTYAAHDEAILSVQWCPDKASVFASSAEDSFLKIWDNDKVGDKMENGTKSPSTPGLIFQHGGHRSTVVDFHWNADSPWTIASVSDDCITKGGGTLQIWRLIDLIYRPEEEVIKELQEFHDHVSECTSSVE